MESGQWAYLGEGGANVLLAYVGLPSSTLSHQLLRLKKRPAYSPFAAARASTLDSTRFHEAVVDRFLSDEYTLRGTQLPLGRKFLEEVQSALEREETRPASRRGTTIDLNQTSGVLLPNLRAGIDTIVVEIKPKWGFLPSPVHLSSATRDIKRIHCRLCMHRHHKSLSLCPTSLPSTSLPPTSIEYCPLDLYSGVESRVRTAVEGLCNAWTATKGQGNNLRIFLAGRAVTVDALIPLKAFLGGTEESTLGQLQALLVPLLVASPLLPILKHLQSSLDPLDIEGLPHRATQQEEPTFEEWSAWVKRWKAQDGVQLEEQDMHLAHLLSATFKDCSLLISFDADSRVGTIKVIDLDCKSIAKLEGYRVLDRDIVASFAARLEREVGVRECVE